MKTAAEAKTLSTKRWDELLTDEVNEMIETSEKDIDKAIFEGKMNTIIFTWKDRSTYDRVSIRFYDKLKKLGYLVNEIDHFKTDDNREYDLDSGMNMSVFVSWDMAVCQ
jgi:hypothetical protein